MRIVRKMGRVENRETGSHWGTLKTLAECFQWEVMGGSGGQGVRTPFLAHYVGFLTLGPKLDSLLDPFLHVDLSCPSPFEKSWIRPWRWGLNLEFKLEYTPTTQVHFLTLWLGNMYVSH